MDHGRRRPFASYYGLPLSLRLPDGEPRHAILALRIGFFFSFSATGNYTINQTMAEESLRGSLKRSFVNDDETNKPPPEKRVRFPKGKKIKGGDFVRDESGEDIPKFKDPKSAASDRADAWLCVDVYKKFDGKSSISTSNNEPRDLVTDELAEINRRIADVLEPGETVLRALRRLKGSTDKKQKMSAQTKRQFDQLTEDAMKLMENGDYNVYEEKREHFEREAVLCSVPGMDQRTYNQPTESEVAALWVDGSGSEEPCKRDIHVNCAGGTSHRIQYYFGCYDPLQYPLMFPFMDIALSAVDGGAPYPRRRIVRLHTIESCAFKLFNGCSFTTALDSSYSSARPRDSSHKTRPYCADHVTSSFSIAAIHSTSSEVQFH
ncbi:CD2-binding protein-related [Striga hermonthica]|uniref:CD2-binding protein-related n=1 Tax=Striga hermonthica TaxID=68872 RepID=A0A9N7MZY5_STRHE|nr:CD2-binding protein-related [Striga hermonthica]